jgi:hypothetical protein
MLIFFLFNWHDKTIVFKPVIALNVLDTEESIPPEIPITKDFCFTWHLINIIFDPIAYKFSFF